MVKTWVTLALLLGAGLAPAAPARAQDHQEARRYFAEGRRYASEERWVEALEAFEASRERVERPGTVFNIAAVLIRLGRARDSIVAVDRFMEISDPRADARMRADAEELRAAAEQSLRRVVLTLRPSGAIVEVDGEPIEGSGSERQLVLDPGEHSVSVSLEGYETSRFALEPGVDAHTVTLTPLGGTLVVESTVETATVTLDGNVVGSGDVSVDVAPGEHEVVIRADGFVEMRRLVRVAPGARLAVEAALQPVPADEVLESPFFWGLTGGGVAAVIAVAIVIGVATAGTVAPYGGNTNVILAPLVTF